jgi:hypothetical protein
MITREQMYFSPVGGTGPAGRNRVLCFVMPKCVPDTYCLDGQAPVNVRMPFSGLRE